MAASESLADSSIPQTSQANFNHLVWDIAWFGLALPATMSFLSVYAIRINASATVLGLLAALPAVFALLTSSLARTWRRRYPDSVRAMYWPAFGHRLVFLLPALTPFFPKEWQPLWLVLAVSLPAFPQGIANVIFLVLMRETVENRRITELTSRRSMYFNLAVAAGTLAFGFWLERVAFPLNYQVMFVVAFVLSQASGWHLQQLKPIAVEPVRLPGQMLISPWRVGAFRRVIFLLLITYVPFFLLGPIVPLRLVDDLGATESFMAYFALGGQVAAAIVAGMTSLVVRKLGSQRTMALGMIGSALSAAILGLSSSLVLMLVASVVAGISWTMTAIAIFGYFNENMPQEDITRYSTLWNQLVMLTIFVGPMVGSQLVALGMDLRSVLLLGAGLRLLAGIAIPLEMLAERRITRQNAQIETKNAP